MPQNNKNLVVIRKIHGMFAVACALPIFRESQLDSDEFWTWNQSKITEASFEAPEASEADPRLNRESPNLGEELMRIGGKTGSRDPERPNKITTHRKTKSQKRKPPNATLEAPKMQDTSADWAQAANTLQMGHHKTGEQKRNKTMPTKGLKTAPSGRPVPPANSIGN